MSGKKSEKFSLKDALFNSQKVAQIADEIKGVYPSFDSTRFTQEVVERFAALELKERIYHIRDMLHKFLPQEYKEAVGILLKALPPELDADKKDDDFGDFIYAPYSDYVATYGCCEEYLTFSLSALRELTKRFSVEFAIRDFINSYPTQTLAVLERCAKSPNYHERRLASEGLRPKLPWAKKLTIDYTSPLKHLDLLYADQTRYVTRSVANHLNDISKIDPSLVIETLKRWQTSAKQEPKEMAFITHHALRTLVKQGHKGALELLGYTQSPPIIVNSVSLQTPKVRVGEALIFEIEITAREETRLLIDYLLHFRTKAGTLSPKVHKLKKIVLKKSETITLKKKHPFKANMSTRKLYSGEHMIEIQINGTIVHQVYFDLEVLS